jgi:hypothetical protein
MSGVIPAFKISTEMPLAVNDVLSVARIVEISNWSTEVYSLANLEAIQLRQDEVLGIQYSHIPNL